MKFAPAIKFESFLKMALSGPPGAGKSYTALVLASLLAKKRVAVIDAEGGSVGKYANLFDFEMLDITVDENEKGEKIEVPKPFTPKRYMEAMQLAYRSGEFDVLIIDGISPEWDDAGGCLQTVDELKRRFASEGEKAATRNAWALVTPHHKDFVNLILRLKMHVICTMQAHKEEVIIKDDNGKIIERKKTLEPIQRDGIERVFDIFAKMEERDMIIDKTRCPEIDGQLYHKPGKEVADIIREWLKGEPLPERPEYEPETSIDIMTVYEAGKANGTWTRETFYATASALLGMPVNQGNYKMLPVAKVRQLQEAVEQEQAKPASEQAQEVA